MADRLSRTRRKNSKQFNEKFRKRFFTKRSAVIWFFTFVILFGMGMGILKLEKRMAKYRAAIDELSTEINDLKKENKELEEQMENVNSPEYIEKMAREYLDMVKKGEYSLRESEK